MNGSGVSHIGNELLRSYQGNVMLPDHTGISLHAADRTGWLDWKQGRGTPNAAFGMKWDSELSELYLVCHSGPVSRVLGSSA